MQCLALEHGGYPVHLHQQPQISLLPVPPGPQSQQPLQLLPGPQPGSFQAPVLLSKNPTGAPAITDAAAVAAAAAAVALVATAPSLAVPAAFSDLVFRCEVTCVLLLLCCSHHLPKHSHALEKYSWEALDSHWQESGSTGPGWSLGCV